MRGNKEFGNYELYEYDLQGNIRDEYIRLERVERIPYYKRTHYEYDSLNRVVNISYYEPDTSKRIILSENVLNQIPFKLIYQDTICYTGKTNRITSLEHWETGSYFRCDYYYLKSGLPLSVKIYGSISEKAQKQAGEYKFKYTFY